MAKTKKNRIIDFLNDYSRICKKHKIELLPELSAGIFISKYNRKNFNKFLTELAADENIKIKIDKKGRITKGD
ncbi:MAG: hypothetical protein KAS39_04410 [Actinomycetia bacterium]|nr:hypothetical protein [Actinomycetes bacterium]